MICPHCGKEHPDTTKFCPETGKPMPTRTWVCDNPDCDFREPLPMTAKFCPNCGRMRRAATSTNNGSHNELALFGIVLGKTLMQDLIDSGKFEEPEIGENGECTIYLTAHVYAFSKSDSAPICTIGSELFSENIESWNEILPFKIHSDISVNQVAALCRKNRLNYKSGGDSIAFILLDKNILVGIQDSEFILISNLVKCPSCGNLNYQIEEVTRHSIDIRCRNCKKVFDFAELATEICCPQCGSTNFIDDGSGYMQYHCQDCQHIWGNEDVKDEDDNDYDKEHDEDEDDDEEIICPECGSDDCEDDGSGYLQFTCNDCGHVWGDEEDDDDGNNEEYDGDCDDDIAAVSKTLYDFFPVSDVIIGETTVNQISDSLDDIEYSEDGCCSAYFHNNQIFARGSYFYKRAKDKTFNSLRINKYEEMFEEWESMGFDWSLSYNEWISLFEDLGFDIKTISSPITKRDSEGEIHLDAKIQAISRDKSIYFGLDFALGHSGSSRNSPCSLFSIVAGTTSLYANP